MLLKQLGKPFALKALILQLRMRRLELLIFFSLCRIRILEVCTFLLKSRQPVALLLHSRSYRCILISKIKVKLILTRILLLQAKERLNQFLFRHFL